MNASRLYDAGVRSRFAQRRIVVVPDAVEPEVCKRVLLAINGSPFILNDEANRKEVTRFYTKNGEGLIAACPELISLERSLLDWINAISGENYESLDNRAIGVAANVTPPGGGFGSHADRHEITIVVFLNSLESGSLCVHPSFPGLQRQLAKLRGPLGRVVRSGVNRMARWLATARVRPRSGTVVAFTKASPHRVDPVKPGSARATLVFGFDRPGVSFKSGQKYYGFGEERHVLKDLDKLTV